MPAGAIELATEILKLVRLLIEDQPAERRRESWERWFKFWEPFWKLCGLEIPKEMPK